MALEKEKSLNSDEIDMMAFFMNVRKFLRLIIIPMIILGVVGLLAGLILIRKAPPSYTNKLIIQVGILSKEETQIIIDTWNSMLQTNQHAQLAAILHCPTTLLKQVSELKATIIPQTNQPNRALNGIVINTNITDTSLIPELQKALISGFETNKFIEQQVQKQQNQLNGLINRIDAEIKELDSLKKMNKANTGLVLSRNPIQVSTINSELVELSEKKTRYVEALKNAVAVNVLQDFVNPLKRPDGYFKKLALCLFGGLALGFIAGAFRFVRFRYPLLFSNNPS